MLADLGAHDIDKESDPQRRADLIRLLSDWHLVAFLGTTQLFSPVRRETCMCPIAPAELLVGRHEGPHPRRIIREFSRRSFASRLALGYGGMADSHGVCPRKRSCVLNVFRLFRRLSSSLSARRRPSNPPLPAPGPSMQEEIPSDLFDEIAAENGQYSRAPNSSRMTRVCPHCTFENSHSGTDCDVCGLPL
jgi:nuclear protein localization family protein 4